MKNEDMSSTVNVEEVVEDSVVPQLPPSPPPVPSTPPPVPSTPPPAPSTPPPVPLTPPPAPSTPPPVPSTPSTPTTSLASSVDPAQEKEEKDKRMRKNFAVELYQTEKSYVDSLNIIFNNFVVPLQNTEANKKPIVSAERLKRIFVNIQSILTCHLRILDSLRERTESWSENQLIGDVFESKMRSITQLYKHYINNYDRSRETLEAAKTNTGFREFLTEAESKSGNSLTLESYLIMPVQRIPRYVMLIDGILKSTKQSHEDYPNLVRAHDELKQVANFINISKMHAEKLEEAKKICAQINQFPTEMLLTGISIKKSGYLMLGGEKERRPQRCFVIVFNNCLVIAKTEKRGAFKYSLKALLPWRSCRFYVNSANQQHKLVVVSNSGDQYEQESSEKKYKLFHESQEEIQNWNLALSEAYAEAMKDDASNQILPDEEDPEEKIELFVNRRKKILDDYLQNEVQYVNHLKGLLPFLSLEVLLPSDDGDAPEDDGAEDQGNSNAVVDPAVPPPVDVPPPLPPSDAPPPPSDSIPPPPLDVPPPSPPSDVVPPPPSDVAPPPPSDSVPPPSGTVSPSSESNSDPPPRPSRAPPTSIETQTPNLSKSAPPPLPSFPVSRLFQQRADSSEGTASPLPAGPPTLTRRKPLSPEHGDIRSKLEAITANQASERNLTQIRRGQTTTAASSKGVPAEVLALRTAISTAKSKEEPVKASQAMSDTKKDQRRSMFVDPKATANYLMPLFQEMKKESEKPSTPSKNEKPEPTVSTPKEEEKKQESSRHMKAPRRAATVSTTNSSSNSSNSPKTAVKSLLGDRDKKRNNKRRVSNAPKKESSGMTAEMKPLFDALKPIIESHVSMLEVLFLRMAEFSTKRQVADVFCNNMGVFKHYDWYCSLWESKHLLVQEACVKADNPFGTLVKQFKDERSLTVEEVLEEVSKRILYIHTTFDSMIKYTDPAEPDHDPMKTVFEQLEVLNNKLVERMKREKQQKVEDKKSKRMSFSVETFSTWLGDKHKK
eukprot:TRINITY_DN5662_c0_g1_i1.p1 TRINITY_DN5662_c0_g1~~TRINITY_DN5662_c0_g1_i1.p1  ORF type:complete len:1143 (-),score=334.15 TRINITY_DN5662_c0_g1_i1:8-3028(-)